MCVGFHNVLVHSETFALAVSEIISIGIPNEHILIFADSQTALEAPKSSNITSVEQNYNVYHRQNQVILGCLVG